MFIGFLSREMILALRSFANKVSAVRFLTNEAGHPVSIVALNNEPLVFGVVLRHSVLLVGEFITSNF